MMTDRQFGLGRIDKENRPQHSFSEEMLDMIAIISLLLEREVSLAGDVKKYVRDLCYCHHYYPFTHDERRNALVDPDSRYRYWWARRGFHG